MKKFSRGKQGLKMHSVKDHSSGSGDHDSYDGTEFRANMPK